MAITLDGSNGATFESDGKVGIGTSSPSNTLDVQTSAGKFSVEALGGGSVRLASSGSMGMNVPAGYNYEIDVDGSEVMRIDSDGVIRAGNLNEKLGAGSDFVSLSGNGYASLRVRRGADTGNAVLFFGSSSSSSAVGSIDTSSSSTSYNTSSDYRLKEDWQPMANASDRVSALKPVNFAWKVDGSRVDGFLAHELQEVVPEAVTGNKDAVDDEGNPVYQGIDQSKLVPLLTAALQEAVAKIESLETRLTEAGL